MSEESSSVSTSKFAQNLDAKSNRLTETYEGEGTTHTPIIEYMNDGEEIIHILIANGKSIAIGEKSDNLYSYASTGNPTYVFTDSRVLALMPQNESDEIHEISYSDVVKVENHFGWTKSRMEIHTRDGTEYHLWLKPVDKEDQQELKTIINDKIDVEKPTEDISEEENDSKEENKTGLNSQDSKEKPANDVEAEYSFTAKKKGIKVQEENETAHYTSEKGSQSTFEFTDSQFIATIPQESEDDIFVVDYESVQNVDFSSSLRKNRMDIHTDDRIYTFWTKDSIDSNALMEFIAEGAGADSVTVDDLLSEGEGINRDYSSKKKGMKVLSDGEETHFKPSGDKEARFVFTENRFLSVIPQDMDDAYFSVDYDSVIDIEYTSGTTKNRIDLYSKSGTYIFWIGEDINRKGLTKFIYDKIRGNGFNKLAEELEGYEGIEKMATSKKGGIKVRGNHTKPEIFVAKFVFTSDRFLAYIPRKESDKLVKIDYSSIVDFEAKSGMTKNRIDIHKGTTIYTFWMTGNASKIIDFLSRNAGRERFILIDSDDEGGTLRIEGWTDGSSDISADVNANSQSKGKVKGVEVGPFIGAKTSSKSSINGEISGEISDNTYTAEIELLKIYKQNLTLKSDVELDIHISDIDNIFKQKGGMVIEVSSTTFRIGNLPKDAKVNEAVDYVKDQMKSSAEKVEQSEQDSKEVDETDSADGDDTAEKLRDLKDLHQEGILTDEEFESKKEDLLEDF